MRPQAWLQNERVRHPRVLLWTIALPIYQVLEPPPPAAYINKEADRKGRMVVDQLGGSRGVGRRAEVACDRFQLRDLKCRVDFHLPRQSESYRGLMTLSTGNGPIK